MAGDTGFLDLMGSNYSQIDKHQMEETLKRSSILLDDEQVELAFQCNRDSFIMTSKRILKIDVQGITGKKVEYLTILWPAIKGFSGDYSIVHSMYTLPLSSLTYRIIPCL
jgi:aspartate carbamoyltransferase regulatory subunit